MRKERSSNIEVLRIVSLFLIVLGHFSWHTDWNFSQTNVIIISVNDGRKM